MRQYVDSDTIKIEGNKLVIYGDLNLDETDVESLPDNLEIHGGFYASKTKLLKLPEILHVSQDLNVSYTKIDYIPDNIYVGGDSDFSGTLINKFPRELNWIKGSLDLSETKITTVPNEFISIRGDLNLSYTKIKDIPKYLNVDGYLALNKLNIKTIPLTKIKGDLSLHKSQIEYLPDNLLVIEELCLSGCKNIYTLPNGLIIGGDLELRGSTVKELPNDIKIFGDVFLNDKITTLPETAYIKGNIYSGKYPEQIYKSRKNKINPIQDLISENNLLKNRLKEFNDNILNERKEIKQLLEKENPKLVNINQKFKFLKNYIDMVLSKEIHSLIITGESGIGKTYTVKDKIAEYAVVPMYVKGFSTPKALFDALYEHQEGLLVFDDCDSLFSNKDAVNILKAALDSYSEREISWLSSKNKNPSFLFKGQIIFISNLSQDDFDNALKTRSFKIDFTMTFEEKIDRMKYIKPEGAELIDAIVKFTKNPKDVNLRTYEQAQKIINHSNEDWEENLMFFLNN